MNATLTIHQIISSRFFDDSDSNNASGSTNIVSNHTSKNSNSSVSSSSSNSTSSSNSSSESSISTTRIATDDEVVRVTSVDGSSRDDHVEINTKSGAFSVIMGNEGDDVIIAGAGNDLIEGGPGQDKMSGGAGVDVFRLERGSGMDMVVDFVHGVDKIDVSAFGISLAQLTIRGDTIDLGNGDTLTVLNVDTLTDTDLIF